ncbi:hypothetical protein GCM10011579_034570 [Streptomyces albiflavescens]|uniref:Uncharacterized protein n=1 Tax=Streptomyces albiflavescens TaxID=1623582 RepID=A0A918D3V9_9ACTN|nr:hypothetical protein [Streptomyces albiflavescens]GGN64761.1 hypothetical protein GCM10011579_034570 [Streptomyces albiflavescens]
MLAEALTALAAAGGTAVVQAAGTSTWQGLQQAVARWFGRDDANEMRMVLNRLDRSADALAAAGDGEIDLVRLREQAVWQERFGAVLEGLRDHDRERAAEALRALLDAHPVTGTVATRDGGQAIGGNVEIRADRGSVAAWQVGDVTLGTPPPPGSQQG